MLTLLSSANIKPIALPIIFLAIGHISSLFLKLSSQVQSTSDHFLSTAARTYSCTKPSCPPRLYTADTQLL